MGETVPPAARPRPNEVKEMSDRKTLFGLRDAFLPMADNVWKNVKVLAVPYAYNVALNFAAAGAILTRTVALLQDSYFEMVMIMDNHPNPWSFLLKDGSSGREMMSDQTPNANMTGTGSLPFILPDSYIFRPTGNIVINSTNGATVGANAGTITFYGARLFIQN